jgi:PPOX class probable F420-dependent enzyme
MATVVWAVPVWVANSCRPIDLSLAMVATLDEARYFSLATFRKTGAAVATPVWFAQGSEPGVYFVFSAGDAGKVKRLRNSNTARIAECDARGKVLGDWLDARAELVPQSEVGEALGALRRKYGWLMWLTDGLARVAGRFDKRTYIRVTVLSDGE